MYSKSQKLAAEAFGTFILVFFGCAAIMLNESDSVAVALTFAAALIAASCITGKISGAHLNPAVSFGFFFDGRMTLADAISYSCAQCIGAFAATLCHVILVLCGMAGTYDEFGKVHKINIGECGFGANALVAPLNYFGGILVEMILTCVFVLVVLCVTQSSDENVRKNSAPLSALALMLVNLVGYHLTYTGVNPARSIAPAIFAAGATDGKSLIQLPIFIIAPAAGSFLAALINIALIKKKFPVSDEQGGLNHADTSRGKDSSAHS